MRHFLFALALCGTFALVSLAASGAAPLDAAARIQAIREQVRTLAALAHEPVPASLDEKERRRAEAYAKWLEKTSLELAAFADRWEAALRRQQRETVERSGDRGSPRSDAPDAPVSASREMQEKNQSFNLQYFHLQQRMQQENGEFDLVSNVMRTKRDAVKQVIQAVR